MNWLESYANVIHDRVMSALKKAQKSVMVEKSSMTYDEYRKALSGIGIELNKMAIVGDKGFRDPTKKVYENSIRFVGERNDFGISFNEADYDVMKFYQDKYFPPTFKRLTSDPTPYNYKNTIKLILDKALKEEWGWPKIIREMESYMSVGGEKFPRWMYNRIVRSELARFTVEGHIRGHAKMGFTKFRRMETLDEKTDKDLCEPFDNWIYGLKDASGIIPAHPSCFSKETEVLTNQGWKMFKDLDKTEEVLTLNTENKDLEWQKPIAYIDYLYKGEMINFNGRGCDLLVTPFHDMLVGVRSDASDRRKRTFKFVHAIDEFYGDNAFYRSSEWKGIDNDAISIGNKKINMVTFCKLMGYFLSEGSARKRGVKEYSVKIAQNNQDNLEKIKEDLKDLPVNLWNGKDSTGFSDVDIGKYLLQFGKSWEKFVPNEIKELSPKYIRIFLDAFCLGDGSTRITKWESKNIVSKETVYCTSSPQLASDIGELIIKVGKSVHYRKNKAEWCKFKNGKSYLTKHPTWTIRERNTKNTFMEKLDKNTIDYNDYVYCVEVPKFNTLLVRRNGHVLWCGNCRGDMAPEE